MCLMAHNSMYLNEGEETAVEIITANQMFQIMKSLTT